MDRASRGVPDDELFVGPLRTRPRRRASARSSGQDDLVRRARNGDTAAFADLYERHAASVQRLSLASVPASQADDVTAEVFARAWRALVKYRGDDEVFVGWLFGIARNVIADTHRRRYRRPSERLEDHDEPHTKDPIVERLQRLHIDGALSQLNRRHRQVIELKYFASLGNDEVAELMGISPGAVNTMQYRALQNLRGVLEEEADE